MSPAAWQANRTALAVRRRLSRHPEWLVLLIAAFGWVWLLGLLGTGGAGRLPLPLSGHVHGGVRPGLDSSVVAAQASWAAPSVAISRAGHAALVWLAMCLAMMLPTTVAMVRYVGFATRRQRRQRSVLLFALGYLATWLPLGALVSLLYGAFRPPAPTAVALLVALAGIWELTPAKRRALRRCHRTSPVRYTGRAADLSSAAFGWRHGLTCLLIGGPAMVALMAAGHPLLATVAVAVLMLAQKGLVRPERWRAAVAAGGIVAGIAILAAQ